MHISPLEEYALRCAVQLARLEPEEHLSASRIGEIEGISVEYVSKIMFFFRQSKLVKSVRGINGGFKLNRLASEISLKEVLDSLPVNKKIEGDFCSQYGGKKHHCTHLGMCSIRPFWSVILFLFDELTSALMLTDLLDHEKSQLQEKLNFLVANKEKAFKEAVLLS